MFLKSSSYKNKKYWRIVESYRDKETGNTKHRNIKYLGDTRQAFEIIRIDKELMDNKKILERIINQLIIEDAYKEIKVKYVKTAIKYVGGKGRNKNKYIENMPRHKLFVSLFGGGCSVELFKKPSKMEVINDLNGELINLLNVIRDNPDRLFDLVSKFLYSDRLYQEFVNTSNIGDEIERAAKYFYISRTAYNGAGSLYKSGISLPSGQSKKNVAKEYQKSTKLIEKMSDRMKNCIITERDFAEIIDRFDSEDTFFFADPPYHGREHYYNGGFDEDAHIKLNQLAKKIKGKIMICYDNKSDLIEELYKDFLKVEFDTTVYMNQKLKGESCKINTEVMFMNYLLE